MRAGLYARVSTREQASEGHSVEAQLEIMRSFCQRAGWEIVGEYVDEGVSGRLMERHQLNALMRDAKAGLIDVVVVHKLDRFYRDLTGQRLAFEELESYGVKFISITENTDFTEPHGKLTANLLGAVNEHFLENLSAETRKGKRQRAKKGMTNASIVPYGYQRNGDGEIIPEPFEAEGVRLAYESYAEGNVSYQDVAQLLNEEGHRTRKTTRYGSRPWSKDSVAEMLRNPFYAGFVCHGDDLFPGVHEGIITFDLWERVKAVRARRSHSGKTHHRTQRVYLLSGVARCDGCGQSLRCQSQLAWAYYRDTSRERGGDCPRKMRSVPTHVIDAQLGEIISHFQLPTCWKERVLAIINTFGGRDPEAEKKRLEARLKRLAKAYIYAGMSDSDFERERQEIENAIAMLEVPQVTNVLDAGRRLQAMAGMWQGANDEERQKMVRAVFEVVYIDLDRRCITGLVPKPALDLLFQTGDKEADLTRLCEVGREIYLERARRDSNPRSSA